jgi:hypothetical protein
VLSELLLLEEDYSDKTFLEAALHWEGVIENIACDSLGLGESLDRALN